MDESKLISATHICPRCRTHYYDAGECDWCPATERLPINSTSRLVMIEALLEDYRDGGPFPTYEQLADLVYTPHGY